MKIVLVQHNPKVGDYSFNSGALLKAEISDGDLVLSPFAALCGCPWEGIAHITGFNDRLQNALVEFSHQISAGCWLLQTKSENGSFFWNQVEKNSITQCHFDSGVISCQGITLYAPHCPTLTQLETMTVPAQANVVYLACALPFCDKSDYEVRLAAFARRIGRPILFVNLCGATDGLVFAGSSAAFSAEGNILCRLPAFTESAAVLEFHNGELSLLSPENLTPVLPADLALVQAASTAIRDYAAKCGMSKAVIGISGGMDSALVTCLAVEALGADNVFGVMMPSPYSTDHSLADAKALCENLGVRYDVVRINGMMEAFHAVLSPAFSTLPALPGDVTPENIQARSRGVLLMAFANRLNGFVLGTGNKSENAMGYCTLYGDTVGALEPLADIYKTRVYAVARSFNEYHHAQVIPENIFTKAPSAELRPGQKDEDSLPPYDILDAVLEKILEGHENPLKVSVNGVDNEMMQLILRRLRISEFKRKQCAPGVQLSSASFGADWNVPVVGKAF